LILSPRGKGKGEWVSSKLQKITSIIKFREKGFTLFEVVVVAAILTVGILMIMRIFPLGLRAKEAAEQCSIATLLGQQIIEEIKREGYEKLSVGCFSKDSNSGTKEGEFEGYEGYRYQIEWRDSKTPYLRRLKVRIFFNEDNSWQYLDLVTYLTKRN